MNECKGKEAGCGCLLLAGLLACLRTDLKTRDLLFTIFLVSAALDVALVLLMHFHCSFTWEQERLSRDG